MAKIKISLPIHDVEQLTEAMNSINRLRAIVKTQGTHAFDARWSRMLHIDKRGFLDDVRTLLKLLWKLRFCEVIAEAEIGAEEQELDSDE